MNDKEINGFIDRHITEGKPLEDYLTINYMHEKLKDKQLPLQDIQDLFNMYTGDGWEKQRIYLQALQRLIEKRNMSLKITERETLCLRIEWAVYDKLLRQEQEIRTAFKANFGDQSQNNTQK